MDRTNHLLGRELEKIIHNALSPPISDICITSDSEIAKRFGSGAIGIDHLVIFGEYFVTIQDKWEVSKPNIQNIGHFVRATNYLNRKMSQKLILAIFVSREEMTPNGREILANENNNYPGDIFYQINGFPTINELANRVRNFVVNKLVLLGILLSNGENENESPKWKLFPHQIDAINTFEKEYLNHESDTVRRGIVSHPTGSGKMITGIAMVGKFFEKHPTKSVLWLTERKDVLQSQFDNRDKLDNCIASGFIPGYQFYHLMTWYNKKSNIDELNSRLTSDKPVFLVANIDSIMSGEKYKNILCDKFGLIILDECHSTGAQETYTMLHDYLKTWVNLKCLIGFSATPVRPEASKFRNTATLFGDSRNIYFISRLSMVDAIDTGIIVPPKFYWIETKLDKEVSFSQFCRNIDAADYIKTIEHINEILGHSITKKAIAWTQTIRNADEWLKILNRCREEKSKYPELAKFKIFITHTGESLKEEGNDTQLYEFMLYHKPCLIICVGRCKEGFDDPRIDVGINLDPVQNRGMVVFTQETGRTLRNYAGKPEGIMMDTFTLMDEDKKVEQICNSMLRYFLFLKQIDTSIGNFDVSKECNEMIKRFKVVADGKIVFLTPVGKEIIINIISTSMKSLDWKNLPKVLEQKIKEQFYQNGIGYEDARKIIREAIPRPMNKEMYAMACEQYGELPLEPELVFKGQFVNWIDYLGIERKYYNLKICIEKYKQYIILYPKIKNIYDNNILCRELCLLDDNFPPNGLWVEYYKSDGIKNINEIFVKSHRNVKQLSNII